METTNALSSSSSWRIRSDPDSPDQDVRKGAADAIEDGGAKEQTPNRFRSMLKHFREQVVRDRVLAAGELGDKPFRFGVLGK